MGIKKNKRILFFYLKIFVCLILIFFVGGMYVGNVRLKVENHKNNIISFYYRDTLNLDKVFQGVESFELSGDNVSSVILDGRRLYFAHPDSISTKDIKIKINIKRSNKSENRIIQARCWIDGVYGLEELTEHPIWKGSKLKHYIDVIHNLIGNKCHHTVVAMGDTLFSTVEGKMKMYYSGGCEDVSNIELESNEYNQIIRGGKYQFLRTNNKLYVSFDNFKSSKLIYNDRRGIKESMVWNDSTNKLLYTMYTPGKIRLRHYLIQYDPENNITDTLHTFYKTSEHDSLGVSPFCRHIHILCKDDYTKDVYVGLGDYDKEPAIYRSTDGGKSLECVGSGSQIWRPLSIFFTKDYIFWTTDSEAPQYINRILREQLNHLPIKDDEIVKFPLFNSALWCKVKVSDDFYLIGSNSEGQFYDDYHRIYGIHFSNDGVPTVYNLHEEKSLPEKNGSIIYHQNFPLCVDHNGIVWCYDNHLGIRKFKINKEVRK